MAEREKPRVKLVFYRSKLLTKVVMLAAVALSTVALISLWIAIDSVRADSRMLRARALELEQSNAALQQDIDALGTPESIAEIAQKELDLVYPDAVLFQSEKESADQKNGGS